MSVATLLSVKGAAAVGLGLGIVTASVSVGLFDYVERRAETPHESTTTVKRTEAPRTPRPRSLAGAPESPAPPVKRSIRRRIYRAVALRLLRPPPSAGGLAEESALLEERAPRPLGVAGADPDSSARTRSTLPARTARLRTSAARDRRALSPGSARGGAASLAERRLAQGGDDLYTARVRRLLEENLERPLIS